MVLNNDEYGTEASFDPLQLAEEEARSTTRCAYEEKPRLTPVEIGRAVGRSRRRVDEYVADLRAKIQVETDLRVFQMRRLGIPQERIASCLGILQQTISKHLQKMATSPNIVNADMKHGFTVAQVAEKHGWPEPLVWSIASEGQEDLKKFKALNWGLQTWDLWSWNDCLPREIHISDIDSPRLGIM